jgi:tetratricopeptide (TPR) repeat protein
MALSYWGWDGDQGDTAPILKPNPRDKNVMAYEMAAFVEEHTGFNVTVRIGGDLDLLRRLIAAGFPVLIEKGFEGPGFDGWMGHYELLTGYDDTRQRFTAQDSYILPDLPVPYDQVESYWRHFNFTFLVIYPPEDEARVLNLLGPLADETTAQQIAAQRASDEIFSLTGRDVFFAWYNRGSSLVALQDYAGAAAAYDMAFQVYAELDSEIRPWRMLWYQTGPYFAYFYSGRYLDVMGLATNTLSAMEEPVLEESYYWRALAHEANGDRDAAIDDLRTSLTYHEAFGPSVAALERLGASY